MSEKEVYVAYYKWLIKKVGVVITGDVIGKHSGYGKLLRQLHSIDFTYKLSNDANRISDGLTLRELFSKETGQKLDMKWPCSVLEVLIGLVRRVGEDVLGDPNHDGLVEVIFWQMIDNLGLSEMRGKKHDKTAVIIAIEGWMNRDFKPDGTGSPFPLKGDYGDQRQSEMWVQMSHYLAEHEEIYEG